MSCCLCPQHLAEPEPVIKAQLHPQLSDKVPSHQHTSTSHPQAELTKPSSVSPKHLVGTTSKAPVFQRNECLSVPCHLTPGCPSNHTSFTVPLFYLLQPHWPPIHFSTKHIAASELCTFWKLPSPRATWPHFHQVSSQRSPPQRGCPKHPTKIATLTIILQPQFPS